MAEFQLTFKIWFCIGQSSAFWKCAVGFGFINRLLMFYVWSVNLHIIIGAIVRGILSDLRFLFGLGLVFFGLGTFGEFCLRFLKVLNLICSELLIVGHDFLDRLTNSQFIISKVITTEFNY
jgi:hypothetical protein